MTRCRPIPAVWAALVGLVSLVPAVALAGAETAPGASSGAWKWLSDGFVIGALASLVLGATIRRQLVAAPRWVGQALVATVLLGLGFRLLLSPVNQFEAWAWTRFSPLATAIFEGPVLALLMSWSGGSVVMADVQSDTTLAVAVLTPLILFAHARYVLKDDRVAVAAAFVVAVLPIHVRFSRGDVAHLQALATSSLTFIVLYAALLEESKRVRLAALVLLPLVSWLTYRVRPENMVYVAIDLAGIFVVTRKGVPWKRAISPVLLVLGAAGFTFVTFLSQRYGANVNEGLSLRTLETAWRMAWDVGGNNTLLNLAITPPLAVALAGLGAYTLWRGGEWLRALFLLGWLATFFVVNAYVWAPTPEMQARYHLNLVTPFVFLVAASVPWLFERPRPVVWIVGGLFALSPLLHRPFTDTAGYVEQREFALLSEVRPLLPEGCVLVEYLPVLPSTPGQREASRWQKFNTEAGAARIVRRSWAALGDDGSFDPPAGTRCALFLDGLACAVDGPGGTRAPACSTFVARGTATVLARTSTRLAFYDSVNAGQYVIQKLPSGRADHEHAPEVELRVLKIDLPEPTTNGGTP